LGSAPLSKVTIISPRSEYAEVVRKLSVFAEFHPIEDGEPVFDSVVQELAVRAVAVYARADETIRDLSIQPGPGTIDVVFRGAKIPTTEIDAKDWNELLSKAESILSPVAEEVKARKGELQNISKEESDSRNLRDALRQVSNLSFDLGTASKLERISVVITNLDSSLLPEFRNSLPDAIVRSQSLTEEESLVLIASTPSESGRVSKVMKALELKPLVLPSDLPQNPASAYRKLNDRYEVAKKSRMEIEAILVRLKNENQANLLSIRELAELARNALDEARVAGKMKWIAKISGYIPSRRLNEFKNDFGEWMVYSEPAAPDHDSGHNVPTLMENSGPLRHFEIITREQGTPGGHEVDPTPLVSFVFPIFFGIMFGDLGHGLILTLFAILIRQRGTGSLRQWGNIFLAAGVSSCFVGVVVGEFFGFPLYSTLHIPGSAILEIVNRTGEPTLDITGLYVALVVALLIGVAHLTTALSLDLVQALREHNMVEVVTGKLPALTMYLSGVGFGIAFIGAGNSFDVLSKPGPAPAILGVSLGISNSLLGGTSLVVVVISIIMLLTGKGIAILAGKSHEGSAASAFGNGAMEVFERISAYLANTISYVRLAIMLMIHAALLLSVNKLVDLPLYVGAPMMVFFNILIIVFEVLIVYIQDLRLHIYEFFTKFYKGTGTPFRRILPEGVRVKIKWN
jgi:V/A-type H+-transporting ATPase subunit I